MKKLLPKFIKNPKGFTLIELLVVITIISILAVVGVVAYSGVSGRARDARRIAEIDAIQKAMEKNYQSGATNPYIALSNADFANGVPPADPLTGTSKCGTGGTKLCEYCARTTAGAAMTKGENGAAACTASGSKITTTIPAADKAYEVCATLETGAGVAGAFYYCKSNAQ